MLMVINEAKLAMVFLYAPEEISWHRAEHLFSLRICDWYVCAQRRHDVCYPVLIALVHDLSDLPCLAVVAREVRRQHQHLYEQVSNDVVGVNAMSSVLIRSDGMRLTLSSEHAQCLCSLSSSYNAYRAIDFMNIDECPNVALCLSPSCCRALLIAACNSSSEIAVVVLPSA
jgi:hypothetical protein